MIMNIMPSQIDSYKQYLFTTVGESGEQTKHLIQTCDDSEQVHKTFYFPITVVLFPVPGGRVPDIYESGRNYSCELLVPSSIPWLPARFHFCQICFQTRFFEPMRYSVINLVNVQLPYIIVITIATTTNN